MEKIWSGGEILGVETFWMWGNFICGEILGSEYYLRVEKLEWNR